MDCPSFSDLHALFILCLITGWLATQTSTVSSVLQCYDCSDTFKSRWSPYTECQTNATAVSVATCLHSEHFCKVERVTVKGATVSITRSCAGECYYGCKVQGYGASRLRCTSCCNETLCNTGSGTESIHFLHFPKTTVVFVAFVYAANTADELLTRNR